MLLVTIRTDKPEAELGLYQAKTQITYDTWQAHRQLAETIHTRLRTLLARQEKDAHDIVGIVCFRGPGSFTGLRIGLTVANTLADSLHIPIVGVTGDDWQEHGIDRVLAGQNDHFVTPEYGAPVHTTLQKK